MDKRKLTITIALTVAAIALLTLSLVDSRNNSSQPSSPEIVWLNQTGKVDVDPRITLNITVNGTTYTLHSLESGLTDTGLATLSMIPGLPIPPNDVYVLSTSTRTAEYTVFLKQYNWLAYWLTLKYLEKKNSLWEVPRNLTLPSSALRYIALEKNLASPAPTFALIYWKPDTQTGQGLLIRDYVIPMVVAALAPPLEYNGTYQLYQPNVQVNVTVYHHFYPFASDIIGSTSIGYTYLFTDFPTAYYASYTYKQGEFKVFWGWIAREGAGMCEADRVELTSTSPPPGWVNPAYLLYSYRGIGPWIDKLGRVVIGNDTILDTLLRYPVDIPVQGVYMAFLALRVPVSIIGSWISEGPLYNLTSPATEFGLAIVRDSIEGFFNDTMNLMFYVSSILKRQLESARLSSSSRLRVSPEVEFMTVRFGTGNYTDTASVLFDDTIYYDTLQFNQTVFVVDKVYISNGTPTGPYGYPTVYTTAQGVADYVYGVVEQIIRSIYNNADYLQNVYNTSFNGTTPTGAYPVVRVDKGFLTGSIRLPTTFVYLGGSILLNSSITGGVGYVDSAAYPMSIVLYGSLGGTMLTVNAYTILLFEDDYSNLVGILLMDVVLDMSKDSSTGQWSINTVWVNMELLVPVYTYDVEAAVTSNGIIYLYRALLEMDANGETVTVKLAGSNNIPMTYTTSAMPRDVGFEEYNVTSIGNNTLVARRGKALLRTSLNTYLWVSSYTEYALSINGTPPSWTDVTRIILETWVILPTIDLYTIACLNLSANSYAPISPPTGFRADGLAVLGYGFAVSNVTRATIELEGGTVGVYGFIPLILTPYQDYGLYGGLHLSVTSGGSIYLLFQPYKLWEARIDGSLKYNVSFIELVSCSYETTNTTISLDYTLTVELVNLTSGAVVVDNISQVTGYKCGTIWSYWAIAPLPMPTVHVNMSTVFTLPAPGELLPGLDVDQTMLRYYNPASGTPVEAQVDVVRYLDCTGECVLLSSFLGEYTISSTTDTVSRYLWIGVYYRYQLPHMLTMPTPKTYSLCVTGEGVLSRVGVVVFNPPIILRKNTMYCLRVEVSYEPASSTPELVPGGSWWSDSRVYDYYASMSLFWLPVEYTTLWALGGGSATYK